MAAGNLSADDPSRGWRGIAPTIETHVIAGHHLSILTQSASELGKTMADCLARLALPLVPQPA